MRETIQNANGKQFHAVSLSGGKDSTAMLLLMIERDMPINMVLSADTGMEFPEMYEHLAKLDEHLFRERGIHITTLRHPKGFEYLMFDEPKQKPRSLENRAKLGIPPYGNGWPGIRVRWCTGQLKTHLITKEVNRLKGELGAIHYVGIADDEAWRCKDERYPLVEWGGMGQNYIRSLLALGFQAFLIIVCVAIYAVLVQNIALVDDIIYAIWTCMGYTVLLCFCLFKTSSLAKSVFNAH